MVVFADDPEPVQFAIELLDSLWMDSHCKKCDCQEFCWDELKQKNIFLFQLSCFDILRNYI